jgi:hypothetical protein
MVLPRVLQIVLVLAIFFIGVYADQTVTATRSKFGLRLFKPVTAGLKLTRTLGYRHQSEQATRANDVKKKKKDLLFSFNGLDVAVKKGVVNVRSDLVGFYRAMATAKDNYERMELILEAITSHKRTVAVGVLCTCGLYTAFATNPEG